MAIQLKIKVGTFHLILSKNPKPKYLQLEKSIYLDHSVKRKAKQNLNALTFTFSVSRQTNPSIQVQNTTIFRLFGNQNNKINKLIQTEHFLSPFFSTIFSATEQRKCHNAWIKHRKETKTTLHQTDQLNIFSL